MTHIAGFERDQLLLLPEAVDDYVEADNSVRFIDVFVDGLDLAAARFGRVEAKATGRPGYAPGWPRPRSGQRRRMVTLLSPSAEMVTLAKRGCG